MYDTLSLSSDNRRLASRLRLQVRMNEYVADQPCSAVARDVSETGLALQRKIDPALPSSEIVTLEIELPGTNETIWASAQPRFDALRLDHQISGLRFVSMARKHERLIRDYLRDRRARLARLFAPAPSIVSRFV
jgi:hypothetical protein